MFSALFTVECTVYELLLGPTDDYNKKGISYIRSIAHSRAICLGNFFSSSKYYKEVFAWIFIVIF